jgi:hypothetical protein
MQEQDETAASLLDSYRSKLVKMTLTHTWRGHGSAIFLEFGVLTRRTRRDGSPGNPEGEIGAMIEWSWRVESSHSIVCGSWSDPPLWDMALQQLQGNTVTGVEVFGRLPELTIEFSNGHRIASFMAAEGDPQWTLFDRQGPTQRWLRVKDGRLAEETT